MMKISIEQAQDNALAEIAKETDYFDGVYANNFFELGHIYGIIERHFKEGGIALTLTSLGDSIIYDEVHKFYYSIIRDFCKVNMRDYVIAIAQAIYISDIIIAGQQLGLKGVISKNDLLTITFRPRKNLMNEYWKAVEKKFEKE